MTTRARPTPLVTGIDRRALLVGVGAITAASLVTGRRTRAGAQQLVLRLSQVRLRFHGVEPGELPPVDASPVPYATVHDGAGREVGALASTPVQHTHPAVLHTFTLDHGTIVGTGPAALEGTYTVVDGTGAYAGVRGTYTITETVEGHLVTFTLPEGAI